MTGKLKHSVMLSSTYIELAAHRQAVQQAMLGQELFPLAMENDAALPDHDLISASLAKVDEADGYVGLISHRYGQAPEDAKRNPDNLSLTELEFRRALQRKIPICMFVMGENHPVPRSAVGAENDEQKEKLAKFIELAKKDRIYSEFNSAEELKSKVIQSLVQLRASIEKQTLSSGPHSGTAPEPESPIPPGWEVVDKNVLAKVRATPPALQEMVQFFDGFLPTWRFALASGVRPRAIVERIANRLIAIHGGATKPHVILLAGAGGEGKSTVMLQAAAALVESTDQSWTCLHRQAVNADLPEDAFANLAVKPDHAWVVLIDDADNVGPTILAATLKIAARTDVHVLLAARDADWQLKGPGSSRWQPHSDFHAITLAGLDKEDARRIVAGWVAWGDQAMGKLKGRSEDDAVSALLGHSRELAAHKEDGDLLGALLITRQGEDMRAHVRTLVNALDRNPVINSYSLRDIYRMVAAMHSENQLYLSRLVLAEAIKCDVDKLERTALLPLRREAMLDPGDTFVLTRHRRIAEAACAIMNEDGDNVDLSYPILAAAARRAFRRDLFFVNDVPKWTFSLARHLDEQGESRWTAARNVAQVVFDSDKSDPQSLTALCSILRRTGHEAEALALLKSTGEQFRGRRDVLYEWSVVAGTIGDDGLGIWLAGKSLSDGLSSDLANNAAHSLAGLGLAFRRMFSGTGDHLFARAQAACGKLGILLAINAKNERYFENYIADGLRNQVGEMSQEQAVESIRKAVVAGSYEAEQDQIFYERLLGEAEAYRYSGLLSLGIKAKLKPN